VAPIKQNETHRLVNGVWKQVLPDGTLVDVGGFGDIDVAHSIALWPVLPDGTEDKAFFLKTKEQGGPQSFIFSGDKDHPQGTYWNPNRGKTLAEFIEPIRFVSGQTKTKIVDDVLFIDASTDPNVEEWVAVR
jgi:hypothetical protein